MTLASSHIGLPPDYTPPTPLHAGPLSMLFSGGDLRTLSIAGVEVVRRIYVAVRDQNWGTVPATLEAFTLDAQPDCFRIAFVARHRWPGIGFDWQGSIIGNPDGSLDFTMDGVATTTFRRNRIGFCILHPAAWQGQPCVVEHTDGRLAQGKFPLAISPHQPFFDLRAITQTLPSGVQVELRMEGDTFEMEDQRNWTDASYKTYSTPLSMPYPVEVRTGDRVQQAVRIRLHGPLPTVTTAPTAKQPLVVQISNKPIAPLPAIGLGVASHGAPLNRREADLLRALHLAHLRVDLDLSTDDSAARLAQAAREATDVGTSLEVALHVGDNPGEELATLVAAARDVKLPVARWLVFARHAPTTPPDLIAAARAVLAPLTPGSACGGGTNLYFTHLNRNRPAAEQMDCVAYSFNPQVHAFDNLSLIETLEAQPMTVASAANFCAGKPLIVSPITLRPRSNPDATAAPPPPDPTRLPDTVDPRQPTLFTAAWTLGSITALATSGVSALTYFETTGWRGVLETADGPVLPDQFPSAPGQIFPVYHILADIGELAGGDVLGAYLAPALELAALTLRRARPAGGTIRRTLLANLTVEPLPVAIQGLHAQAQARTLDAATLDQASRAPDDFRRSFASLPTGNSPDRVVLAPYAVLCIDELIDDPA